MKSNIKYILFAIIIILVIGIFLINKYNNSKNDISYLIDTNNQSSCSIDEDCILTSPKYDDGCSQVTCGFISMNKKSYDEWNKWYTKNYDACKKKEKELMRISGIECLNEAYVVRTVCDQNQCSVKKITSVQECEKTPYNNICYDYFNNKK